MSNRKSVSLKSVVWEKGSPSSLESGMLSMNSLTLLVFLPILNSVCHVAALQVVQSKTVLLGLRIQDEGELATVTGRLLI